MEPLTSDNSPNLSRYVHRHARDTPDDVVLLLPQESPRPTPWQDPSKGWLPCSWSSLSHFIIELILQFQQEPRIGPAPKQDTPPVAALVISPAEDMLPITLALVSLGYAILPINPHLSSRSLRHLLDISNASLLVCSTIPDFFGEPLLPAVRLFVLDDRHRLGVQLRMERTFAPPTKLAPEYERIKKEAETQVVQEPAYYLHSSGSTGMPKLVPWRNTANFAQIVAVTNAIKQEMGPDDKRVLFLTKDLFAVIPMGLSLRILYGGKGWTLAFPSESVMHQTAEGLLEDMIAVQATNISVYTCDAAAFVRYCSAKTIDAGHQAKQGRYLHFLRGLGPIPCGGSRIDRALIREAIPLGIQIKSTFGTTESSAVLTSSPDTLGSLWGTIKPEDVTEDMIDQVLGMVPLQLVGCRFDPLAWNSSELEVAKEEASKDSTSRFYQLLLDTQSMFFSSPDTHSEHWWETHDLFRMVRHPQTQKPIYVYETRTDDMVLLGNGATLHPARIEESIYDAVATACSLDARTLEHDLAQDGTGLRRAIDFMLAGTGRSVPSLLVEGMSDPSQQQAFTLAFQAHAQTINASFPGYSPLQPKLFYFLKPHERLPRTIKNTVNRKKAEQDFKPQLDLLYEDAGKD